SSRLARLSVGPMTVLLNSAEGRFVEVEGDADDHLVVAVPSDGRTQTIAVCFNDAVNSDAEAPLHVEFYFPDRDTNALFHYMTRGDFHEAGAMASALARNAQLAMNDEKAPAKLAMLFAGYVLLRENRLELLAGMVDQLAANWSASPDVAAIRME